MIYAKGMDMKQLSGMAAKARKDKDVIAVAVFGSFARKEKYRDIDVCIFLRERRSALEMSKKRLDYMKEAKGNVDIQIFQQLPVYIRHRVLKEGKIIFCSDESLLYDIALDAAREYEDFRPIYREYLEAVRHG